MEAAEASPQTSVAVTGQNALMKDDPNRGDIHLPGMEGVEEALKGLAQQINEPLQRLASGVFQPFTDAVSSMLQNVAPSMERLVDQWKESWPPNWEAN